MKVDFLSRKNVEGALTMKGKNKRIEKWEQGQTAPNDQAAALILMVKKYPDTLKRLEDL